MTYGVVDTERGEMTFARAGHCPLIYVPADQPPGLRKARFLTPDGLVVGLQLDDGTMFDNMLQEETITLAAGDLVVWFTDGIAETMNERFECFGEPALARSSSSTRTCHSISCGPISWRSCARSPAARTSMTT